jgi:DNA-binding PadR family transcriptional regulator
MMLQYALLGLLRTQPDYGYRLKRRFDGYLGSIWQLNIGQVYQTLHQLEAAALVEEVGRVAEDDGTTRRRFAITSKGGLLLDRWLHRPPLRPRPVRDESLVRLLVLEAGTGGDPLDALAQQEQVYRRHLVRLEALRGRLARDGGATRVRRLALDAEVLHTEAHLRWLHRCREALAPAAAPMPVAADAV